MSKADSCEPACAYQKREGDPTEVCCRSVPFRTYLSQRTPHGFAFFSHNLQPSPAAIQRPRYLLRSAPRAFIVDVDPPIVVRLRPPQTSLQRPAIASLFDVCRTHNYDIDSQQRRQPLQRVFASASARGAVRRHTRTDVSTITAEAMGDERRRDECLGWSVFAMRPGHARQTRLTTTQASMD
jgi:hypothetical protein